jgi:hypothetical protein
VTVDESGGGIDATVVARVAIERDAPHVIESAAIIVNAARIAGRDAEARATTRRSRSSARLLR